MSCSSSCLSALHLSCLTSIPGRQGLDGANPETRVNMKSREPLLRRAGNKGSSLFVVHLQPESAFSYELGYYCISQRQLTPLNLKKGAKIMGFSQPRAFPVPSSSPRSTARPLEHDSSGGADDLESLASDLPDVRVACPFPSVHPNCRS